MKINEAYNELNEELISTKGDVDIYKNPKTITRFPFGSRAFLTPNGDLFIADDDGFYMTHNDILLYLQSIMVLPKYWTMKYYIYPFRKNDRTQPNVLTLIPQTTEQFENEEWVNNGLKRGKTYNQQINSKIIFQGLSK